MRPYCNALCSAWIKYRSRAVKSAKVTSTPWGKDFARFSGLMFSPNSVEQIPSMQRVKAENCCNTCSICSALASAWNYSISM